MKTNDIFEALTDIDDKFIAAAHPIDMNDNQPTVVPPAPKKPLWKTLVPVAACAAVFCTAAVFGIKYFKERPRSETSEGSNASFSQLGASAQNVSRIEIPEDGSEFKFTMEEFSAFEFKVSNKAVTSVFKTSSEMDTVISNTLFNENLRINGLYLADLNGDGRREICATVYEENKGQGIMVSDFANGLKYGENGSIIVDDSTKGIIYALPSNVWEFEYALAEEDGVLKAIKTVWQLPPVSACPNEISREPLSLDNMTAVLSNNDLTKLDSEGRFMLAEFHDKTFEVIDGNVVMGDLTAPDAMIRPVQSGIDIYLADLNGDGKREICSWGSIGSGIDYRYINVYDIANDESYFRQAEVLKELITLEVKDGELYAVTTTYHNYPEEILLEELLTLDILKKVSKSDIAYEDIPLFFDQTFTMNDFPGFSFTVDTTYDYTTFTFAWESNSVANHVTRVYLCDVDGDGKREICMNCPFAGNGLIRVYGYMNNGEMGCAVYYEEGGCWLNVAENGTLKYYTNDKIEPFKFSKSDLKPNFTQSYSYELLGWEHSIDFTDIAPALGAYEIKINDRRMLNIKHNGEQIFDSGIYLQDLYSIPDAENNSVILIYKSGDEGGTDGMLGAIRLSENSAERYDFEKGVYVKPTTDELLLVNADGSETLFKLPDNGSSLF